MYQQRNGADGGGAFLHGRGESCLEDRARGGEHRAVDREARGLASEHLRIRVLYGVY